VASRLGVPINQEDLAGKLLAFSYVVADPIHRRGVRVPARDVDAYLHLWNVIGHLLGVRDELLVRDVADAAALVDTIRRRQFKASPEGQELTGWLARIANWFFVHVLGRIERDLPRYQLMSRMAPAFGRDLLDALFKLERGGERAPFDIPDHLARNWDLLA
jgi:hypothetical protein